MHCNVTFQENTSVSFQKNTAKVLKGGAISLIQNSYITLRNNSVVVFTVNRAVMNGGSIYLSHSKVTFGGDSAIKFIGNHVDNNHGAGFGAAIFIEQKSTFVVKEKSVCFTTIRPGMVEL